MKGKRSRVRSVEASEPGARRLLASTGREKRVCGRQSLRLRLRAASRSSWTGAHGGGRRSEASGAGGRANGV
jgi:hypothetical protein